MISPPVHTDVEPSLGVTGEDNEGTWLAPPDQLRQTDQQHQSPIRIWQVQYVRFSSVTESPLSHRASCEPQILSLGDLK